ncbi:sensory neuron membrane protein 2-like isoform X2 [Lycorma delicatula]|uniref:sensory neuron membrane protein 2-like isoform X2 n=1 Tax=Lycorma delicatula TaxID=130591 RepID=UPI003F51530F
MHQFTKSFAVAAAGGIIIVCGLLLHFIAFPLMVDDKIKKATALEDGSEALKHWQKPPSLDFAIYLFNVTNPLDVHYGQKPILREIGPYVYSEYHDKEVIKYHEEDDTVSYNIRKKYFFNQEKSQCHHETDLVTVLNPALMGTILMVEKLFPFGLIYVNHAIPYLFPNQFYHTIFVRATVQELLFTGIFINCSHTTGPGKLVCDGMKGKTPITIRQITNTSNYVFSYFFHKNNSLVGPFRISRGRNNLTQLGQIKMYEEKVQLDIWPENSTCNIIHGTDSTVFPPFIKKTDSIYIFVPDVCGSMFAEFDSEITLNNVITLKFVGSSKNFGDPLKYEANKCHCDDKGQIEGDKVTLSCPKEGVMYLTPCYHTPVAFSQPHFYMADKEYLDYPLGLNPNKTKHETFVQIEPKTGTPVEGYKRMQMNMHLHVVSNIDVLENISTGLLPLLWIEEGFKLDDDHLSLLVTFYHLLNVLNFFPWFLIFTEMEQSLQRLKKEMEKTSNNL